MVTKGDQEHSAFGVQAGFAGALCAWHALCWTLLDGDRPRGSSARIMLVKVDFAFVVSVLVLGGCGTFVQATALNAPPRPLNPRPAAAVEVYSSSPPAQAHVDVALIQADQINGMNAELPEMIAKIREKAGQMGCDAIFISGASERAGAGGDAHLIDPGSHLLMATCIAYLEPVPIPVQRAVSVPTSPPSAAPVAVSFVVSSPVHR
jgi:hypothetical protein